MRTHRYERGQPAFLRMGQTMQLEVVSAVAAVIHHLVCLFVSPALNMRNSLRTWTATVLKVIHLLGCHFSFIGSDKAETLNVNADNLTVGGLESSIHQLLCHSASATVTGRNSHSTMLAESSFHRSLRPHCAGSQLREAFLHRL